MVTERLSQHPDVECYSAVFSEKGYLTDRIRDAERLDRFTRINDRWRDLKARLRRPGEFLAALDGVSPESTVGVKHHLNGVVRATKFLLSEPCPKIVLTRRNLLACYSSQKLVEITGMGFAQVGEVVPRARCRFVPREFAEYRRVRKRIYVNGIRKITETGAPLFVIDYTAARTEAGIAAMLAFLGKPPAPGEWPTLKRHGDDILARFENPDEVMAHLKAIRQEDWAEEADEQPPPVDPAPRLSPAPPPHRAPPRPASVAPRPTTVFLTR